MNELQSEGQEQAKRIRELEKENRRLRGQVEVREDEEAHLEAEITRLRAQRALLHETLYWISQYTPLDSQDETPQAKAKRTLRSFEQQWPNAFGDKNDA